VLFEQYKPTLPDAFYDLIWSMLEQADFEAFVKHPYWGSEIEGEQRSTVALDAVEDGREVAALRSLQELAWDVVPEQARSWLVSVGVELKGL